MNKLDKFSRFDHVKSNVLDSHHISDKFRPTKLEVRLDIFLFLGLQCLNSCPELYPIKNGSKCVKYIWWIEIVPLYMIPYSSWRSVPVKFADCCLWLGNEAFSPWDHTTSFGRWLSSVKVCIQSQGIRIGDPGLRRKQWLAKRNWCP